MEFLNELLLIHKYFYKVLFDMQDIFDEEMIGNFSYGGIAQFYRKEKKISRYIYLVETFIRQHHQASLVYKKTKCQWLDDLVKN